MKRLNGVGLLIAIAVIAVLVAPTKTFHVEASAVPKDITPSLLIMRLIQCESGGRNVTIIDSNGLPSRGILQFQDHTWVEFSIKSGIVGVPTNPHDAIRMAEWAVKNNLGWHWSCWDKINHKAS